MRSLSVEQRSSRQTATEDIHQQSAAIPGTRPRTLTHSPNVNRTIRVTGCTAPSGANPASARRPSSSATTRSTRDTRPVIAAMFARCTAQQEVLPPSACKTATRIDGSNRSTDAHGYHRSVRTFRDKTPSPETSIRPSNSTEKSIKNSAITISMAGDVPSRNGAIVMITARTAITPEATLVPHDILSRRVPLARSLRPSISSILHMQGPAPRSPPPRSGQTRLWLVRPDTATVFRIPHRPQTRQRQDSLQALSLQPGQNRLARSGYLHTPPRRPLPQSQGVILPRKLCTPRTLRYQPLPSRY